MHTKYKRAFNDPHYTFVFHYLQQLQVHTKCCHAFQDIGTTYIQFIAVDRGCLKLQRQYSPEQLLKLEKQRESCYKRHTGYEIVRRRREWRKLFSQRFQDRHPGIFLFYCIKFVTNGLPTSTVRNNIGFF